jgi:hypothetical protein
MFEPNMNELVGRNTGLEFADRTFQTKKALARFLKTLTPAQLANTEVLVDDELFVVFYPLNGAKPARHFDTGEPDKASNTAQKSKQKDRILAGLVA